VIATALLTLAWRYPSAHAVAAPAPLLSLQEPVDGTAQAQIPGGNSTNGSVPVHLNVTGSGRQEVQLAYDLLLPSPGPNAQVVHGSYTLTTSSLRCSGPAVYEDPGSLRSTCTLPGGSQEQVFLQFQIDQLGDVSGLLQVAPAGTDISGVPSTNG